MARIKKVSTLMKHMGASNFEVDRFKELLKLIKRYKPRNEKYYRIYFFDPKSRLWVYTDPVMTKKRAREVRNKYYEKYDHVHIEKITEIHEEVS